MSILTKIFSSGAAKLAETVGSALDGVLTSKEEKEAAKLAIQQAIDKHVEAMEAESTKRLELELKDMDSARNREIAIVTSDKAPLLNKIVQPVLAIVIVVATLTIWALILFRNYEPKINEAMIIGSLTTLTGMVLSYYFGSSTGSASKQKQLDKMANKE